MQYDTKHSSTTETEWTKTTVSSAYRQFLTHYNSLRTSDNATGVPC